MELVGERVREAYAKELSARQRFFPTVGVGTRFLAHDGRTQATEGNFLDVTKQSAFAGAALTAEWEVGEAVYATLAARQRTCASVAAEEAGGEDAALKAGEAYLDLVRAEASLAVAKDAVDLSQRIAKETEDKVGAGSGFAGDVLRAKAQLAHDRATVSLAAEARRTSAVRLAEILNLPPEVDLVPRDAIPIRFTLVAATDPEAMLIRDALLSRADVREADALACAADKERDAARYAPLVPRVGVEASAGGLGRTYGDLSSSDDLRITLGWTIGSGGLFDTGRIAEADSRYRLASITSSRVRARVVREVREAYAMLSERARAIGSAEQGARDATEALDLYRKRLTGAVGLPLEVVVAQETLTRARLDWIEATVGYDKAQLRLLRALGGDRISAGR
ncbi:MAG: TolC family protein [Planctomycetes bacterium]|nr:TolC family protein [Planctomycetota bacterium]